MRDKPDFVVFSLMVIVAALFVLSTAGCGENKPPKPATQGIAAKSL